MTDKYSDLKKAALAATPGPWDRNGYAICTARVEGETTYVEGWHPVGEFYSLDDAKFIGLANPATVLALIAENEKSLKMLGRMFDQYVPLVECEGLPGYSRVVTLVELSEQNAQLKAEAESLRADAERWKFVRNPICASSLFAVWSGRTKLFLGKDADEAIDAAMSQEPKS